MGVRTFAYRPSKLPPVFARRAPERVPLPIPRSVHATPHAISAARHGMYGMVWQKSVKDGWLPKRPGPASDKGNVARQTLRAGIRAPPPGQPYHLYPLYEFEFAHDDTLRCLENVAALFDRQTTAGPQVRHVGKPGHAAQAARRGRRRCLVGTPGPAKAASSKRRSELACKI